MIRRIIDINEEKCNGCGLCVTACHEGAIGIVGGKAKLLRDDYCDGLGDCLPVCPTGAISFVEREAAPFDKEAVLKNAAKKAAGCPSSACAAMNRAASIQKKGESLREDADYAQSELGQWPVQIKLVPVNAPYLDGANLLIAADCTAYAYAAFHKKFMRNRITLIGCPKLDETDYSEKLSELIKNNNIKSVKVVRMEVPCCSGIERAVRQALAASGKTIPWQVVVITRDGIAIED
ncbi:MAG: ATP-binding protein [Christensenellales bacterium]|jgi:ferredoxin